MTPPLTPQFNRAFPNPELTVDYDEAMRFIQLAFKRFPHGQLKAWAAEQEFNYPTLISLRNNSLRRPAPLQVQKILEKFNFPTEVIRVSRSRVSTHEFVFQGKGDLDLFHHQLKEYEDTKPTDSPASAARE